jgi:hypothetical protein
MLHLQHRNLDLLHGNHEITEAKFEVRLASIRRLFWACRPAASYSGNSHSLRYRIGFYPSETYLSTGFRVCRNAG